MPRFVFRRAAERDVLEAQRWYARHGADLADAFVAELRRTMDTIIAHPLAAPVAYRETRRAFLHRFPYSVFYRVIGETVVVIGCFHHRRDPARWLSRR